MYQQISVENGSLRVRDEGTGPTILLVHGFPLDHTMWRAQFEVLRGAYRVLSVDLRGFGTGADDAPVGDVLSMEQLADDCDALLDGLQVREPVVFCGLSMGGYIAWQFWARHASRLAGLVLCDTRAAADSPEAAQGRLQMAERVLLEGPAFLADMMAEKMFDRRTRLERPEQIAAVRQVMTATAPRTIAAALRGMAHRPDMTSRLAQIDLPALVVCGASDVISTSSEMRSIVTAMPSARFVEVPDAGHMSPLEQPAVVNQALLDFLASLGPRGST